jgi:hypothetical protein
MPPFATALGLMPLGPVISPPPVLLPAALPPALLPRGRAVPALGLMIAPTVPPAIPTGISAIAPAIPASAAAIRLPKVIAAAPRTVFLARPVRPPVCPVRPCAGRIVEIAMTVFLGGRRLRRGRYHQQQGSH